MSLIPKIRPGEEISIDKLNAIIEKVNGIETSKKELEIIRNEIRTDVEKHNAILESVKASQEVVQQVAQSDSLETITALLQQFIYTNSKPSTETTQRWGMTSASDDCVEIYLEEDGKKTASFILNQGAVGPQGPEGKQGPQGIPGLRGEIGPRGFRGITGKQGEGASIEADYVNYVEDLSLLPSDLQQYLRIQIKHIDSEGNETLNGTCYIPTQGYIYVPEIYHDNDSADGAAYIRFKKIVNTSSTAAGILDESWKVTGPVGPTGAPGAPGVPGTGLTCSNLIKITDNHVFSRKAITAREGVENDTLESQLGAAANAEEQTLLITSLMGDVTTEECFGIIPIDSDTIENARKFTFVEKLNNEWRLLRGVTFPVSQKTSINVYNKNIKEPKTENLLSQALVFDGTTYYKLIVGTSFIHIPSIDSDFKTYLYTVYERARLDNLTSNNNMDVSYYVLIKSVINAGVEIPNMSTDILSAKEVILPQDTGVYTGYSLGSSNKPFKEAYINNINGKSLLDMIYPINSIYITLDTRNPEILFGGKWEKIEGRFLLGTGSGYTLGATGGEATVALTKEQLPPHSHHNIGQGNWVDFNAGEKDGFALSHNADGTFTQSWSYGTNEGDGLYGRSHNNMPPYLAVNIWKRTR